MLLLIQKSHNKLDLFYFVVSYFYRSDIIAFCKTTASYKTI